MTWIWGISNGVWISLLALLPSVSFIMTFALGTEENEWAWWVTLLSFLPFVGFAMAFVLGAKGNEWAWANKRWDNVQHFQRTQRMWTWWGLGITIVGMVLMGLIMGLGE